MRVNSFATLAQAAAVVAAGLGAIYANKALGVKILATGVTPKCASAVVGLVQHGLWEEAEIAKLFLKESTGRMSR
ncbi:hypothetical protein TeGR_g3803 [Tetraparma gracilis]|uniref:Uncharacterized protein n=1 Tax=Tetraparma gracilis TaxID=2962635 RepID=A0ABQ6N9X2_9STRA|nr:hypothetical protein TeGR_g3803 [Tetraparma gracilis]